MKNASVIKAALAAVLLTGSVAGIAAVSVAPAYADIASSKALVDAAKAKGIVGEQSDGYLGFVKASSDAALKAAVAEINAGRHNVFAQAAAKNSVSIEAAGQSAFVNAVVPKLQPGEYYQNGAGNWVQK